MGKITVISGGARSGKSRFGEQLAMESGKRVMYLATAIAFDEGMKHRINLHRIERPGDWATVELYRDFKKLDCVEEFKNSGLILLDCLTLLISNQMMESGLDFDSATMEEFSRLEDSIMTEIDILMETVKNSGKDIIIISNEVGLGIVPDSRLGSVFRDISGRANQHLAHMADEVYMVFLGIPNRIK